MGVEVGVDRPDVAPVAVVALAGPRDDVGGEVVDPGVPGIGQHRHDRAAHVVHRAGVLGVGAQGLEQRVGGEDVVAHRGEALVGRVRQRRRVRRLLQEPAHLPLGVGVDDAEVGGVLAGHPQPRDGHAGTGLQVLLDHLARVHAVHVVGTEDDDDVGTRVVDQVQALEDGVGAAGVPARTQPLLGRHRGDVVAQELRHPPGGRDVPVQAVALVLGEDGDLPHLGVDQVRQDEVDQPVVAPEGHRRLGPVLREGCETLALAPGEDDAEHSGAAAHVTQRSR